MQGYTYVKNEHYPVEHLIFETAPEHVQEFLDVDHEVWTLGEAESDLFEDDIAGALDLESIVAARTTFGGTGNEAVREQMDAAKAQLAADEAQLPAAGAAGA